MERRIATNLIIAGGSAIDLFECLLSLAESEYSPSRTVVLDNSPAGFGGSVETAFRDVELLRPGKPLTFAAAANFGLRHAIASGSPLVFLLNDDVTVHHETLGRLVQAEKAHGAGLYAPEIWPYAAGAPRQRYRFDWSARLVVREAAEPAKSAEPRPIDYAEGSAVMISAEVFEATEGFDEEFGFYFEDADFSVRAADAGYPVLEIPGARVWHKTSASAGRGLSPFKAYYRARNTLKFAAKHRGRSAPARNALYHFGEFVIPEAVGAFLAMARGKRAQAQVLAAIMRGTVDNFTGRHRPFPPGPASSDELRRL